MASHKISVIWRAIYGFTALFCGLAALFTGYMVIPNPTDYFRNGWLICGMLFYMCMGYVSLVSLNIHMTTSPTGIEYHGVGFHIRSSWEDLEQIQLVGVASSLGVGVEIITTRKSPEILSANWIGKFNNLWARKGIPLFEFGSWRHTSLADEIRKYAPKLLA